MLRQPSLIVVSLVFIAGFYSRESACNAADDAKATPQKTAQPADPEKQDWDPMLEKPAHEAKAHVGSEHNPMFTAAGLKKPTAVTVALVWLANHQLADGSWSFQNYQQRCVDKTCAGVGETLADSGATALGLLPFLAAGQTHKSKGPYKEHIVRGLEWLIKHQQPDGNLATGAAQITMYSHAMATIALCESYSLTADRTVGQHAQAAVNFIVKAQNKADGGWRYNPGDPGDTCVTGWQMTALKSAHIAGLDVGEPVFAGERKWLNSVAVHEGTEYAYQPGEPGSNTMTSVGLLGRQYLGVKPQNAMLTGGAKYLMNHIPNEELSNIYYWYYATQVMHNMGGNDWDTWNKKIRDLLLRTQVRNADQCANGSWNPKKDEWGRRGGRLMQTSLSALTLEVYYRYLPIFKTGNQQPAKTK